MKTRVCLLSIFLVLSISLLTATDLGIILYNFNLFDDYSQANTDAKSTALGHTRLSNSVGAFNLFNNPSLLPEMKKKEIGVSTKHAVYTIVSKSNYNIPADYKSKNELRNGFCFTPIAFTMPFKMKDYQMGWGIGQRQLYDYDLNLKEKYNQYMINQYFSGGISVFTGGLGCKVMDHLSVGLNLNYGKNTKQKYHLDYYDGLGGSTNYKSKADIFFYMLSSTYQLENQQFAVSITPNHRIKYKNDFIQKQYGYYDLVSKHEFEVNIPLQFEMAIKSKLYQKLWLTAEYKNKALSEVTIDNGNNLYCYLFEEEDQIVMTDPKNGNEINLGLELQTKVPLRIGFYSASVPVFEHQYISSDLVKRKETPLRKTGFTYGLGFNYHKVIFDLSADFSSVDYDERRARYNSSLQGYDGYYILKKSLDVSEYMVSARYSF